MKLSQLLSGVDVDAIRGDPEVDISEVTSDSRLVTPGALFVAIRGFQQDGSAFIHSAAEKGAAALVVADGTGNERSGIGAEAEVRGGRAPITIVFTRDERAALALIAANLQRRPADRLSLIGVTGTSGKTTTTKMIESIIDATGEPAGLIGTIEYRAGDERLLADRTTPDAVVLHEWFRRMVNANVHHAVMEVSSHALALKRTYGLHFAAAVFTNL
jgi:UDP-N-acetylmuramoyl-L-alanyl-D-glutamate--2,6-diaminopimelate ligase